MRAAPILPIRPYRGQPRPHHPAAPASPPRPRLPVQPVHSRPPVRARRPSNRPVPGPSWPRPACRTSLPAPLAAGWSGSSAHGRQCKPASLPSRPLPGVRTLSGPLPGGADRSWSVGSVRIRNPPVPAKPVGRLACRSSRFAGGSTGPARARPGVAGRTSPRAAGSRPAGSVRRFPVCPFRVRLLRISLARTLLPARRVRAGTSVHALPVPGSSLQVHLAPACRSRDRRSEPRRCPARPFRIRRAVAARPRWLPVPAPLRLCRPVSVPIGRFSYCRFPVCWFSARGFVLCRSGARRPGPPVSRRHGRARSARPGCSGPPGPGHPRGAIAAPSRRHRGAARSVDHSEKRYPPSARHDAPHPP